MAFKVPEKYRVTSGPMRTSAADGNNGAFDLRLRHRQRLHALASDGAEWEHVSVSRKDRAPTWDEMCQVKAMFWGEEDVVVQFHPAKADYVNMHPFCLHLWRPINCDLLVPHPRLVGVGDRS